ncbi:MAG: C40 family peptidase [Caulobacteraceae bacterium]
MPSQLTDPRLILSRGGLAAKTLDGLVAADRYVDPTPMQVITPAAGLHVAPGATAEQADQLLFGERFDVLETLGDWVFGQARRDGYVGYAPAASLAPTGAAPTHWVSALRTFAFDQASIKSRPAGRYSRNALVTVEATDGRFARIAGSGWIVAEHLSPIGAWAADPATVALTYLGAPYLWGGRDSLGLDCSGLVQQALYACGRGCPRDSDQQLALGQAVTPAYDLSGLQRNDLVFWRGHVGIMLDAARLLHANAHHMAVAVESLADAISRIRIDASSEPIGYRRLTPELPA